MKKRILSLVLALSMMISLFPVSALAQTPGGGTAEMAEENGEDIDAANGADVTTIQIDSNGEPVGDDGANGKKWEYDSTLMLKKGTYTFSAPVTCGVIIYNGATVVGGTFEGTVWNEADGKISGGTFADVSNRGTIIGGTFTGAHGSIINHTTIAGGVFEKNVTNGDSGDEGISASITGGLFKAEVQNKAASAAITGGVFAKKPTGSGTIANGYTLTTSGRTSKFVYAADGKEIDLGQSVYVIPNDTDALKVVGDGVSNWDVADSSGTHALTNWDGVTLKQDGSFALNPDKINGTTLTFTVSTTPVTPDPELVLAGGVPDTSEEHAKQKTVGGKIIYYGNGWEYDGTTLTLNPTEAKTFDLGQSGGFLKCKLEVGEKATVEGWIFLSRPVENHGVIDGPKFHTEGNGYSGYPTLTNYGTVRNCYVDYGYVTNNGTMENVSFVCCKRLTNNAGATIKNAIIRTDDRNGKMSYSNSGKIDEAVFDFSPSGEQKVHVLKASSGETVGATLSGIKAVVFGTEVYIVGEPEVKVKISGSNKETITDVNGNTSYGGLTVNKDGEDFQTFTVQKDDEKLVLNKTISPTYDENLEIGADGKPVTENRKPYGNSGVQGDGWTYDGTTLTLSGSSWSFSKYPAVTCSVALSCGTALYGGVFKNTVSGSGYITGGIFLNRVTVSAENINTGIFKTAPNGTTCYTVKAGDSSKLGVKVNGAEFVDFGTDEAQVVNRIGNFVFSVQLRDASGKVVKIANINGKETGFDAYGSYNVDNSTAVRFTMPSENVVLNQEPTTKTYTLTVDGGYIGTDENQTNGNYEAGATIKLTAEDAAEGKEFDKWELDGLTLVDSCQETNATIVVTITGNATAKATYKNKTYKLTLETDGTENAGIFYRHNGHLIGNDSAFLAKDDTAELKADVPEGKQFDKWELSDGLTLVDGYKLADATIKIKMPGKEATAKAFFKDKTPTTYTLTLTDATANPDKTEYNDGDKITLTAKDAAEGKEFDKWELDGLTLVDGCQKTNATIEVTINGNATAKATYKDKTVTPTPNPDDQPKTYTVTVKGGKINGETKVEGIAEGTKLTVDVDESEVPEGMTFDVWSIRFPESIKDTLTASVMLHDPHMSFAMPEADITIEAQYRSSELPGEDDGPSTLGTMATVAVGGAAAGILVWQGVSLGVDSYLQLNLPKGVAVPANRRELVVLLWETAGKPEAALPSLYSDVPAEEIELQKATRWAIDNGLVKPADDSDASRFDPDRYVTKYDVFGAWLKLKKLMK